MDKAIERLDYNHNSMNKANEKLRKAIEINDDQEIYEATGELLMWIITTDEWHKKWNNGYRKRKSRSEEGQYIYGLLHAYNSIKHNMNFIKIHRTDGGLTLPMTFPAKIEKITFHWIDSKGVLEEGRRDTIENYKKYIEGKELVATLDSSIKFLNRERNDIKNKSIK